LIDLISWTPGVEQKSPHLTPGVLKVEFSVAMIISQVRANWKPAAAATPLIELRVIKGSFFKNKRVLVN